MILKPSNIEYNISEHFPPATKGKVGVAVSGGLESMLIARIALDVYGSENVVLMYSDNIFTTGNENNNINVSINVSNASELLAQEIKYVPIDVALHDTDKISSAEKINKWVWENWNVEFTMWGFTKLFFDVSEFKEDPTATYESIISKCYQDPLKYRSVIEEFHLPTGAFSKYVKDLNIPGDVYSMLTVSPSIKRPFDTLNKSEVIDLYIQLGYLELAYKTHSCVTDSIRTNHMHCGICFNCQQRHDAFAKLEVKDLTRYQLDNVKNSWNQLQEKLKAQH